MNSQRFQRRPSLHISPLKEENVNELETFPTDLVASGRALTPDIQSNSPPNFECSISPPSTSVKRIGKYLVRGLPSSLETVTTCEALNVETGEEHSVKVLPLEKYRELLAPYWAVGEHKNVNGISEILLVNNAAYTIFGRHVEDLHSYIRRKRRLRESEASALFKQIVIAVQHCHSNGVVVRDVKLRKFVFQDSERTQLLLDGLEEGHVLEDEDNDRLTDKHGCLAYVSPEILYSTNGYSGKFADVWSLGVVLYTMLVGQYPFHDGDVGTLFKKIRHGSYSLPDSLSSQAKCLLRNLLRTEPTERIDLEDVLGHPWFNSCRSKLEAAPRNDPSVVDREQMVPEVSPLQSEENDLLENLFSKNKFSAKK